METQFEKRPEKYSLAFWNQYLF